ncbi:MAG TPA: hypothetical protein VG675_05915 [Bryobacteraceae bacterium]|nr:hypothetical protein [Bryobacteraceae bacterium]
MQLRYLGFDQSASTRIYKFDVLAERSQAMRYRVTADLTLFRKHGVGIQEGPTLCAHKLTADLESLQEGEHTLTSDDLLAYVTGRAAIAASKAASRRVGIRRRSPMNGSLHGPLSGGR